MNLLVVYLTKNNNNKMEVELNVDDVLEFLYYADSSDVEKVETHLGVYNDENEDDEIFKVDNLYDREKVLILKKAMTKYNLDELIEKLKITQIEAM